MIWDKLNNVKISKKESRGAPVLKSCPFCGCEAEYRGTEPNAPIRTFFVQCICCHNSTDLFDHIQLCADRWNRRI